MIVGKRQPAMMLFQYIEMRPSALCGPNWTLPLSKTPSPTALKALMSWLLLQIGAFEETLT